MAGFALDRKRDLFYVNNYMVNHLLILNVTEDSVQIIVDAPLFLMGNVTQIWATEIVIDETADCFYVSDRSLYSVVKFQIGSTTGRIVAGGWPVPYYKTIYVPMGLTLNSSGYLYIVDYHLHRVVQLRNEDGELRTIAGQLLFQYRNLVIFSYRYWFVWNYCDTLKLSNFDKIRSIS